MSGKGTDSEKLNFTLEKVCSILNENNINDWFIFFGTLLGIVRENICIDGDDDLDIMINCDYQKLRSTFEQEGFTFTSDFSINDSNQILKTKPCDKYASFDFYMCEAQDKNYFTPWQNVEVQNVEIEVKEWRSARINLPKNPETLLEKMYGSTWRTPIKLTNEDKEARSNEYTIYNTKVKTII